MQTNQDGDLHTAIDKASRRVAVRYVGPRHYRFEEIAEELRQELWIWILQQPEEFRSNPALHAALRYRAIDALRVYLRRIGSPTYRGGRQSPVVECSLDERQAHHVASDGATVDPASSNFEDDTVEAIAINEVIATFRQQFEASRPNAIARETCDALLRGRIGIAAQSGVEERLAREFGVSGAAISHRVAALRKRFVVAMMAHGMYPPDELWDYDTNKVRRYGRRTVAAKM